jgi:hypothetical protein
MAKPNPSTQVAEVKEAGLPAVPQIDYAQDEGLGFENADAQAYAIPFLIALQSGSPQCKRSDGRYIEGAIEGMILNSISLEIYDGTKGVEVIPCHFRRSFVEWISRDDGGGFVCERLVEDPVLKEIVRNEETGRDELPNGHEIVDTRTHYVLTLDALGVPHQAVVAMSSTAVKKSKRWMSMMQDLKMIRPSDGKPYTPPMFSHFYRLTTVPEKKNEHTWMNWEVARSRPVEEYALYAAAKQFRNAIIQGIVKEAVETLSPAKDDVPF